MNESGNVAVKSANLAIQKSASSFTMRSELSSHKAVKLPMVKRSQSNDIELSKVVSNKKEEEQQQDIPVFLINTKDNRLRYKTTERTSEKT